MSRVVEYDADYLTLRNPELSIALQSYDESEGQFDTLSCAADRQLRVLTRPPGEDVLGGNLFGAWHCTTELVTTWAGLLGQVSWTGGCIGLQGWTAGLAGRTGLQCAGLQCARRKLGGVGVTRGRAGAGATSLARPWQRSAPQLSSSWSPHRCPQPHSRSRHNHSAAYGEQFIFNFWIVEPSSAIP